MCYLYYLKLLTLGEIQNKSFIRPQSRFEGVERACDIRLHSKGLN